MKALRICTLFCVGIFLPFALVAQEAAKTSSIVLSVRDKSGAVVRNAHIQIVSSPNNVGEKLTTDSDGKLSLDVSPGSYNLIVESPGFLTVKERIEAKSSTHQAIEIVMTVEHESCPPGPCPIVTNIFPVSFPAQSEALSPDGRYAIVGVDSDSQPYHAVFLEDQLLRTRRKLFNYDRHLVLLWKSDSKLFAVTDYATSDNSQCRILSVDEKVPPIQVLDVLSHQLSLDTWKQLETHLSNHHAYVEAEVWDGPMSLMVKISGYGDADPAGFAGFYEVLLPTQKP